MPSFLVFVFDLIQRSRFVIFLPTILKCLLIIITTSSSPNKKLRRFAENITLSSLLVREH